MPARKPVQLHKMHGTYRPCRHDKQEVKPLNTPEQRSIPDWLPEQAKPVYASLMESLPPLSPIAETTLAQLAILKAELQADADKFKGAKHSQLRQLTKIVDEWARDFAYEAQEEVLSPIDKFSLQSRASRGQDLTPYEIWQLKRLEAQEEPEILLDDDDDDEDEELTA